MDYQTGYRDGFAAGIAQGLSMGVATPAVASFSVEQGVEAPKRKPSAYNRRYAAAYRRIKRSKTLKSGKMAKGYGGKTGHKKIVKMAHAEAKKGGRRRR